MRLTVKPRDIEAINRRREKIDPQPQYQRTPVWNRKKQQLLLDTILRGYDVPKIYLRAIDAPPYSFEVVDGQQRLRAIWEFHAGEFELGQDSADLPTFGDLTGLSYSDLSPEAQDCIATFELQVVEIEDASETEIRDLFKRLQEGVSLSPAEKRHAMEGAMRDFLADVAGTERNGQPHAVFALTSLSPKRFAWEDVAAHVMALELAGGPTELKAVNLRRMYADNAKFDPDGKVARKFKAVLNFLARVLADKPAEADIKWGFVDLYLLVSVLWDDYVLKGREADFERFYVSFETERRSVDDPTDLLEAGSDAWDRDLYDYISAFEKDGAKSASIKRRHEVYLERCLRDMSDLMPKDPKRLFTREERTVIYRLSGGKCANSECHKEIAFEDMHADHVDPHAKGGRTRLDNAQALCAKCNLEKGAGKG